MNDKLTLLPSFRIGYLAGGGNNLEMKMSSDNEVLWVVTRHTFTGDPTGPTYNQYNNFPFDKCWVFRTRQDARNFASAKQLRTKKYDYVIGRASWGNL